MSEREQRTLETILEAVPKMSEFDKGYLLGKAEGLIDLEKKNKQGADAEPASC